MFYYTILYNYFINCYKLCTSVKENNNNERIALLLSIFSLLDNL